MLTNPYEAEHIARLRRLAPECMVLLKKDGSFPLKEAGKIALYGSGARRTLKGGRGSADVNVKSYVTVEQGLKNAGFTVTSTYWLDEYEKAWHAHRPRFRAWLKEKIAREGMETLMENLSVVMPEPEYEIPLTGDGDTAIYVLSRLCGEGVDRQDLPGDFRLSRTEIRDILALNEQYPRFMLVLNTACIVDLSPVAGQVKNILLLSQLGMTIGDSLADVLLGRVYPSGKLAATWAAAEDYRYLAEFGDRNDTRYREGVYVGYRYFDTAGIQPLFPFGYGLGYTDFSVKAGSAYAEGTEIILPVAVENIGKYAGKETVQLYVSAPEGKLAQPLRTLAAFQKTGELLPGEREELLLRFSMESLASTDAEARTKLLEQGDYVLLLGNTPIAVVSLPGSVITERIRPIGGDTDFSDTAIRRESVYFTEGLPRITLREEDFTPRPHPPAEIDRDALQFVKGLSDEELCFLCTGDFVGEGSKSIIGDAAFSVVGAAGETTARFSDRGVPGLVMADGPSGLRLSQRVGRDEKGLFPIAPEGENLMELENKLELLPPSILKPLMAMFPASDSTERHGEIFEQNCSAIPVAAAIAQSWSEEVAEACADLVGEEMECFHVQIWLAPALNIQRHPLCGRTFEYYSEDPLISGKMAAAMTRGIQKHRGCAVTIKHFIANNQETNRFRTSSDINERALRDIYARGFEIAVKESQPYALMSSYNLLNGVHTSERYGLLETLLREEWGYQGIVMSDFLPGDPSTADEHNRYRKFASAPSVKAGNDLLMPGGKAHYENLLAALHGEDGACRLSREELERCAARNVALAWKLKGKAPKGEEGTT